MADSDACTSRLSEKRALVWVRTRPTDCFPRDQFKLHPDGQTITIHRDRDVSKGVINNEITDWTFAFDQILCNVSQECVYSIAAADMVSAALQGFNGTIMAYGQTGAGKTFTMTGTSETYDNRGIVPRALSQLFQHINENPDYYFCVRVSYLEIYNEVMLDLLSGTSGKCCHVPLSIMEDARGRICVRGLQSRLVSTEEEALNLLFMGEANRAVSPHCLNGLSSRSHCIFTLYILNHSRCESDPKYTVSKLHFVDLAGSERLKKTQSEGVTKCEAMSINKSLSFLGQAVAALARRSLKVPFRQSRLTHFLKDALGGNCLTRLIANIWVDACHIEETLSTLRFASRMMLVAVKPTANVHLNAFAVIKQLEQELFWMKKELAMHDMITNRSQVSYEAPTERQRAEIMKQAKNFLSGSANEIEIINLRQLQVTLESFRDITSQLAKEVEAKLRTRYVMIDKTDSTAVAAAQSVGLLTADDAVEFVVEPTASGLSQSPPPQETKSAQALPKKKAQKKSKNREHAESIKSPVLVPDEKTATASRSERKLSASASAEIKKEDISSPAASVSKMTPSVTKMTPSVSRMTSSVSKLKELPVKELPVKEPPRPSTPPKKIDAFEDFKKDSGSAIYKILKENKELLFTKKKACNATATRINETKQWIDMSICELENLRAARLNEGVMVSENCEPIIDEAEYEEMQRLSGYKAIYRSCMEQLNSLKLEIVYCEKQIELLRQKMVQEFENWYAESFLCPKPAPTDVQASNLSINNPDQKGETLPVVVLPTFVEEAVCEEEDDDQFENLQMALLMENPDSVPFYRAQIRRKHMGIFYSTISQFPSRKSPRRCLQLKRLNKPICGYYTPH